MDTPFAAGRSYRFEVILDFEEGYYLADSEELDAYVNGNKALVTEAAGNGTAFTVEYSLAVSSGLRGQVVSFYDDSDVTVALFADGSAQPQYTTTVPAGEKSGGKYTAVYDIPEVAAGTYTMKVMKNNHVTREYTIVVGSAPVVKDVKLCLKGDANGSGTVDIEDAMLVFYHVAKKSYLGDEGLAACDTNADGTVDIEDAMTVFYFVAKKIDKI